MPNGKTHAYGYSPTGAPTPTRRRASARRRRATTTTTTRPRRTLPGRGTTTFARKTDGRLTGVGDTTWGYANPTDRFTLGHARRKTTAFRYDGGLKTAAGEYPTGTTTTCAESMQLAGSGSSTSRYDGDGRSPATGRSR